MLKEREKSFAVRFNSNVKGFKYSRGYVYSDSSIWIECNVCGSELKRSGGFLRKVIRGEQDIYCNTCKGRKSSVFEMKEKDCANCGVSFKAMGSKLYCSGECWRKARNYRLEVRKRRTYNELVDSDSYDTTITLERLYKRDEGVCHICKEPCDWDDKVITSEGHFIVGNSYPSIDHYKPLNKGGVHSWCNVDLSHYLCNIRKSDKYMPPSE